MVNLRYVGELCGQVLSFPKGEILQWGIKQYSQV
jgi:hypothetical protein